MEAVFFALVTFVPMLLVLVVVHELGHFVTARAYGVKVLEFGIGYPPKVFGIYTGRTTLLLDANTRLVNLEDYSELTSGRLVKIQSVEDANGNLVARVIEAPQRIRVKGPQTLQDVGSENYLNHEGRVREVTGNSLVVADMLYSLNLLPLGGFVKLAGENNPAVPRSLASKGAGPRAVVLAAGAFMNAILPIILFTAVFIIPQQVEVGSVVVSQVEPGSPAETAGVKPNDIIVVSDGDPIETPQELVRSIARNPGSEIEWVVDRGAHQDTLAVTPRSNPPQGQGPTGIGIDLVNVRTETRYETPWTAVGLAFTSTWDMLVLLKHEISGWVTGDRSPQFSGPIGIAQITGEISRQGGVHGWLVLSVLLSINLAVLNILPIPMLDGGRLLFVAIEWVRRGKRVPPEKEGLVHLVGFVVLIGLIILISANDIKRLIEGVSPLGG
jgi:regulator of sigma E protease